MKIGELAQAAECTTETVRYYEKQGLLPKPERGENNYRTYGLGHLKRLRFIRNCRALDLSHAEIGELLAFTEQPAGECNAVNEVIDKHIAHVELRLRELQILQDQLRALRKSCRNTTTVDQCQILRGISRIKPNRRFSKRTRLD